MDKVRLETSGSLGLLTLANPPLNLLSEELIKDLRTAVNQAEQLPLRALLVRADGKVFSGGADVLPLTEGVWPFNHPLAGRIIVDIMTFSVADNPELRVVAFLPVAEPRLIRSTRCGKLSRRSATVRERNASVDRCAEEARRR
jgi:hypothetical protein